MRIDPKHLLILAEISDSGGFTEAAASLGTTQPTLSRIVKTLEQRFGEPLFVRTRRPFELTAVGRALVEQGRIIRIASTRADESVDRIRSGVEGELRLGGTPFFTDGFVSGLIADFQKAHPNITVRLSYGYTDDLVAGVRGGRLDVALCPLNVVDPAVEVAFLPLIEGRNIIACRVGHPLLQTRRITASKLANYAWIEPPPNSPLAADVKSILIAIGAERIRIVFSGGGLGAVINYLMHSDSLAVLPHTVVFGMRHQKTITALSYDVPHPARNLGLLHPSDREPTPLIARFMDYMQSSFQDLKALIQRHENIVVWKR